MLTATSPPGEAEGGQEEQPQAGRGESGRHSSAHLSAPPRGPGEAPALPAAPLRCGPVLSRGRRRCAPRRCHIPHCHGPARTRFITAAVRNRPGKCRFPGEGPRAPRGSAKHPQHCRLVGTGHDGPQHRGPRTDSQP